LEKGLFLVVFAKTTKRAPSLTLGSRFAEL
jgi:hypothetical protein